MTQNHVDLRSKVREVIEPLLPDDGIKGWDNVGKADQIAQAAIEAVCEELMSISTINVAACQFHNNQFNNRGEGKKFIELPSHSIERYLAGQQAALQAVADKLRGCDERANTRMD